MRILKYLILILLICGVIVSKFIFFPSGKKSEKDFKGGKNEMVFADAFIIKFSNYNEVKEFPGTLVANKEVELCPERQGKVIAVFFKEGTNVQKGQLLLKINDASLQAQLSKLKVNEVFLSQTEERKRNLLKINGISQQEYDASLSDLNNVRAEMEYIKVQIEETEIKAPFTGKIGITNVTEGSYITPSAPVLRMQQNDPIKIDFFVPEKNASNIKTGDIIEFRFNGSSETHSAKVIAINSKIETDTRQLLVRALTSNKNNEFIIGNDVVVSVNLQSKKESILVPTSAVVTSTKGKKVFIYRSGKCEEVMVESGNRNEDKLEIIKGLKLGDTLLTSGILQLKKEMSVKLKKIQ